MPKDLKDKGSLNIYFLFCFWIKSVPLLETSRDIDICECVKSIILCENKWLITQRQLNDLQLTTHYYTHKKMVLYW
jgi:hypothetical protein